MKKLVITFLAFALFSAGKAQELAYDEEVMERLKKLADSMQTRYQKHSPKHTFHAMAQSWGYFIQANSDVGKMKADLEAKMPIEQFRAKYPKAISEHPCMVLKETSQDDTGALRVSFSVEFADQWGRRAYIQPETTTQDNRIIFKATNLIDYQYIMGVYLMEDFKSPELPAEYAKQIGYADFMIGKTPVILATESNSQMGETYFDLGDETRKKQFPRLWQILSTIQKAEEAYTFGGEHPYPAYEAKQASKFLDNDLMPSVQDMKSIMQEEADAKVKQEVYRKGYTKTVEEAFKNQKNLQENIQASIEEMIKNNQSFHKVEELFNNYLTNAQRLELKRRRSVTRRSDDDIEPFRHMADIAERAAEMGLWDVFMPAHMVVLNDHFAQRSNLQTDSAGYVWVSRKSHYKEIEQLGLDAFSLLLGTLYKGADMEKEHYTGDVVQVGKALAQSSNPTKTAKKFRRIIADESLDTYNRLLVYVAFFHFNQALPNRKMKEENERQMKQILLQTKSPILRAEATRKR